MKTKGHPKRMALVFQDGTDGSLLTEGDALKYLEMLHLQHFLFSFAQVTSG